jgi:hypothetical protein
VSLLSRVRPRYFACENETVIIIRLFVCKSPFVEETELKSPCYISSITAVSFHPYYIKSILCICILCETGINSENFADMFM